MADRYLLESGAPDGYLLEDGTGVLLMEPFVPNTESDDWWAGSALSFAAVAVVGAVALLASNTAIARTFVHQDEIPAAAATPASETSAVVPTQRARVSPVFHQGYAQDELPPQAAAPIVEEVYDWKPLVPTSAALAFGSTPQWDDQALSWSIDEQYNWTPGWGVTPQVLIVAPLMSADDEIVQQPTFLPEESDAPPLVVLPAKVYGVLPVFDADWTPAAPPEDDAAPSLLTSLAGIYRLPQIDEVDWVPAPAVTAPPEESEAPAFVTFLPRVVAPVLLGDDDLVQFIAPTFPPEETDAPVFAAPLVKPNAPLLLGVEDEWVQFVAPPVALDHADFTVDVGPAPAANVVVWATDEEIIPPPAPPSIGGGVLRERVNVLRWYQADDLPIAVAATPQFEDDSWQVITPALQAPNRQVWNSEEDIVPTPTFGLEEFESPLFVPGVIKANAPLWFGDDEWIAFVAPTPVFEDDSWNILRSVPVNLAPYFAMLFQGSTDDGSIIVIEPPPPPAGTHTWLLVKRRTRR